ncbi:MAG: DegT/DnrJ/EryC1/StrS family aminotransferase [Acidimicrobiia bacterium]
MNVPLVDLKWQHAEIVDEVTSGLEAVMANTAFIQGPQVAEFEQAFAAFCDVSNCVGVASGTDALEMAVRGLGLGAGDEVIVPANSFIASTLGVIRAGVQVKLVDCDPDTYLIDVDAVDRAMSPTVKAIMPVHLFGQTAPVEELSAIAGDVAIIEDAAQSQGARRNGKPAGSLGYVAATSFYPGKNIGAYGDAGGVLTDDDELAQQVRNLGNWGSPQKYHHPVIGFNSRLDTIQAVVLSAKLARLADWNKLRQEAADRYTELLQARGKVLPPVVLTGNEHIWHLYVVRVPERDRVLSLLHENGIGAGVHYPIPMHQQGALSFMGHQEGDFPATEAAAREMLSLPMFPGITAEQQDHVVDSLNRALDRVSG